jgi:adenine-specific DNA-methyltransferase
MRHARSRTRSPLQLDLLGSVAERSAGPESLPLVHADRLSERTELRRVAVSEKLDAQHRARWGQFFTPPAVADFLATLIELPTDGELRVLDPGAGVGSLSAALVARAIVDAPGCAIRLVAFEADPALGSVLAETLSDCERTARAAGVEFSAQLRAEDFLSHAAANACRWDLGDGDGFDACVMNPPYRKITKDSHERAAAKRIGLRVTNLYTAFLGAAVVALAPGGQLSAITPRSFANGPYFLPFRRFFLDRMSLELVHVYERRGELFADAAVLQENVVVRAVRGRRQGRIKLSMGRAARAEIVSVVEASEVIHPDDPQLFIRIPIDEAAATVAGRIARLPARLTDLALNVSTGRVVDFRTRENLRSEMSRGCAPLIYPGHLSAGRVHWPCGADRKPTALVMNDGTRSLVLPSGDYVLVRRFSSKEEPRRVSAAWFSDGDVGTEVVAFENHLNVFHRGNASIEPALAIGLTVFLNTSIVDEFVRQFSGHTQINATDLRLLRYPDRAALVRIGALVTSHGWPTDQRDIDALAGECIAGFEPATRTEVAA